MNEAVDPSPASSLGAKELLTLSASVGRIVMRSRKFAHRQGTGRRISQREIASFLRVSHTAVQNAFVALRDRFIVRSPDAPARTTHYKFQLADVDVFRRGMERPAQRGPGEPCVTLGTMNFKGGVAKSTTTAHVAQFLALHGYRTLAIDCDPQGTLSTLFGLHPDMDLGVNDTLVPYFAGKKPDLRYCIRPTDTPLLSVIPANVGLAEADLLIPARQRDEREAGRRWYYMTVLADGLRTIQDDYDVILLDCPPSMSYLTTVATQACDALLVPMRPSMPDFASSAQFIRMFGGFQADVDEVLKQEKRYDWLRVLITLDENNKTSTQMEGIIRKAYGELVLSQKFPYLAAVATAAKHMRTVYDVSREDVESRQLNRASLIVDEMCGAVEALIQSTRANLAAAKAQEAVA